MEDVLTDDNASSSSDSGKPIREASSTIDKEDDNLIHD